MERWIVMKRRILMTMVLMSAGAMVFATYATGTKTPAIPFSHKKHIEEVEAACEDCHKTASSATTAASML